MRTHKNTLLAMKLATVLMSLCAMALVIVLLTSKVMATADTVANNQPDQAVVSSAPVAAQSEAVVAPPQPRKVIVIKRIVRSNGQSASTTSGNMAVTITNKPVAQLVQTAAKPAATTAKDNLPQMPQLAAIPDVPNVSAPAGGGGGGGGQRQSSQPQPAVKTKTS